MVQISPPGPSGRNRRVSWWLFLCVLAVFLFQKQPPGASPMLLGSSTLLKNDTKSPKQSVEVNQEDIEGIDVLWTRPAGTPSGLMMVAHGCSHSNTDWFSDCEGCIGLPEELAIVDIGLELNLAVVAISSSNRESKCWNTLVDAPRWGQVLSVLSQRLSPDQPIPLYAFGASSGGGLVSQLAKPLLSSGLKLDGFLSQIMARQEPDTVTPCQVYITMDRDVATDRRAKELVRGARVRTKHIPLPPIPVTTQFLKERIPHLSNQQATDIVRDFQTADFLASDGLLVEDPRKSKWRPIVSTHVPKEQDSLRNDQSPISEVLNVAYAQHEMTRDGVKEALEFCMSSR